MNFFTLRYQDHAAYFGDQAIALNPAYLGAVSRAKSDNVKLGIRPEFVEVFATAKPDTLAVHNQHVQDLGTYAILTFSLNQQTFKARLSEDHPPLGETVHVRFPDDKLSLYVDEYRVEVDHE